MREAPICPETHLFVCTNRRDPSADLGEGCSTRGDLLYDALKNEVRDRKLVARVWVTRTHCIGICPAHGATVAIYPRQRIVTEVDAKDAAQILDEALRR